jgi:hypothetical protein
MDPRETDIIKPVVATEKKEIANKIEAVPPVVESFLDTGRAAEVWPEDIANNESFLEQLEKRKRLNESINNIFDRLPQPDMPLETAINQKHITEEQAVNLYESLSELLESDQDYKRIILYLPFEILPNKAWHPSEEKLQQASNRFRGSYMKAWQSLLSTYDVRANFIDGDVLEVDQRDRDLPRVVKAAHLIPKLVESGLIEIRDVVELMERSDDQILKDSIADTLPVLADLGFINGKEIKLMEKSKDRLVSNMALIIASNMEARENPVETTSETITLSTVQEALNNKFSHIDAEEYGDMIEKRKIWLKQKRKQEAVTLLGAGIRTAIMDRRLADEAVTSFLTLEAGPSSQQALIEGIREAIESVASTDPGQAQTLYAKYKEPLLALWKNNNPEVRESLSKAFRRLRHLNIVDDEQLAELNIVMPTLAGPFSENLKIMEKEMLDIRNMVATIESNPELSQLIYPVVLVYGSGLKGYGAQSADIDLGVLVKPGTSFDDQTKLGELLEQTFTHEKIRDKIVKFWLEENEEQLGIHDFESPDVSLGESHWTHILFGAAWEGDKNVIRELHEKLLVPYMYNTDRVIQGRDARSVHLEEMERDTLQYRLMHKGYEKFFPPYGGIHTPHADEIDGNSIFWDSGYRQIATKLFASRVFLPKINRP